MVKTYIELYREFVDADDAWQACLTQVFGKKAGDVRYTREGHTHPSCVEAYKRFVNARDEWYFSLHNENPWKDEQ